MASPQPNLAGKVLFPDDVWAHAARFNFIFLYGNFTPEGVRGGGGGLIEARGGRC